MAASGQIRMAANNPAPAIGNPTYKPDLRTSPLRHRVPRDHTQADTACRGQRWRTRSVTTGRATSPHIVRQDASKAGPLPCGPAGAPESGRCSDPGACDDYRAAVPTVRISGGCCTMTFQVRQLSTADYPLVISVIDQWWGGRQMADKLPRLFFEHFTDTSFAAERDGRLAGFLTGTGKRLGADHIGVPRAGRKDLMPGALASNPRPVDTDPLHCFHLLGQPPIFGAQQAAPGSWPRSRRAGCQASPDPRASVRPIATSAHPAWCLTGRRPRRRGTWGPCRRADLRSSVSFWRASEFGHVRVHRVHLLSAVAADEPVSRERASALARTASGSRGSGGRSSGRGCSRRILGLSMRMRFTVISLVSRHVWGSVNQESRPSSATVPREHVPLLRGA